MQPVSFDEPVFDRLAQESGTDLISLFIPTHEKGREVAQDRIHLKNQLSEVEETLEALGYKPRQREDRLAQATVLLEDREFWEHQGSGLALFIDESGEPIPVKSTRTFEPHQAVMPVFHLRPLLAGADSLTVPVLALTRDAVTIFSASSSAVDELDVDFPSYQDVNWFVDRETQRQQHPDRVGTQRSRHGHEPSSRADEDLARFLREVDDALKEFDTDTPLIVLGDDHMVAEFANHTGRSVSSPANSGIRAPFSPEEVLEKTKGMLDDMTRERTEAARAEALDRLGEGRATTDVEVALPAAFTGRVEAVVSHVRADPTWGRMDLTTHEVEIHDSPQPGDVDLLDRLVVWSRSNGATLTPSREAIEGQSFVATLRY